MKAEEFRNIYRELIVENPLAVRAVLKILDVEFTTAVPTLAVTCEARPRLLVNLDFVSLHCRTDAEVKAVICHEFLHVLLRHTDNVAPATPSDHLALDAVINAIIHRALGPEASAMMARYYRDAPSPYCLLRPLTDADWTAPPDYWKFGSIGSLAQWGGKFKTVGFTLGKVWRGSIAAAWSPTTSATSRTT